MRGGDTPQHRDEAALRDELGLDELGQDRGQATIAAESKVHLWQTAEDCGRTVESDGTRVVKHQDRRISAHGTKSRCQFDVSRGQR